MKRLLIFILICLIITPMISTCEDGQININKASADELDNLYGIGPVKAEEITKSRSFKSVDELIEVKGIGEVTLSKIKEQGLACVDEEIEDEEKNESIDKEVEIQKPELIDEKINKEKSVELEIVKLDSKDIKTENNNENLDNTKYVKYGFVIFCTLLGFLFMLKKNKYKTEFERNG